MSHLPASANVAAGALIFGQFLATRPYSAGLAIVGTIIWLICTGLALVLAAGEE